MEYYLAEYDAIWPEYAEKMTKEQKNLVIEDAEMRGLVTEDEAVKLRKSKAVYFKFLAKLVFDPAIQSFAELVEEKVLVFRGQRITEKTLLNGFREAYLLGLVSDDEWENANPELVRHYLKRGLIASLSKLLRPWGGWNSDLEEKLWNALKAEKW